MTKSEKPSATALALLIGNQTDGDVPKWAVEHGLSASSVYRMLRTGETNSLKHAHIVEVASDGGIPMEGWL